ncbi:MAG: hypothetical protein ACRD9S_21200 [Pyrinomonadaceae bacterium]
MSDRSQWKMLHLLYVFGKPSLTLQALQDAGIYCYEDTIQELVSSGAVHKKAGPDACFYLSEPARAMLSTCLVANRRWESDELWVDYPRVFVIMPFSEDWSSNVFEQMIRPAILESDLECVRGDTLVRIDDMTGNILTELLHAGIVVADVSAVNANVYYELGLTHGLGKQALILKQKDAKIPADFAGAHYYEYELNKLESGKEMLSGELVKWATDHKVKAKGVAALKAGAAAGNVSPAQL